MQNLEILNTENDNSLKNVPNPSLINEILDEQETPNEEEIPSPVLLKQSKKDSNGRNLFWKKKFKKPPKPPSHKSSSKWNKYSKHAQLAKSLKREHANKQSAPKKEAPRIPRKRKIFTPIPPYVMGQWRPRTTLKPPKFSLQKYGPDYCPCKKTQKGRKSSKPIKSILTLRKLHMRDNNRQKCVIRR